MQTCARTSNTIVIQGHTDERGSASFNWDLSAKRANCRARLSFPDNKTWPIPTASYFAASAYFQVPSHQPGQGRAAYQQNRRIEISVIPRTPACAR